MTKLAGAQDMHMKPNKTITTMADFGFGPYAWLKEAADETDYVGINIANLKMGMTDFKISKQLVMGSSLLLTHLKNISKSKEKNMVKGSSLLLTHLGKSNGVKSALDSP